jgi:hypothetical protein
MVGVFDYYADAAFNSTENIFGEGVTFVSGSGAFPNTIGSGIVDNTYPETNEYGNTVLIEAFRVTCNLSVIPEGFGRGDSIIITVNGEEKTLEVMNVEPDVNASKVFYLSE